MAHDLTVRFLGVRGSIATPGAELSAGGNTACLEVCAEYKNPVSIVTKAPLIERDLDVLVQLHRFDWRHHLSDWEPPTTLHDEVTRWDRIVAKSPEPAWLDAAQRVREALLERMPPSPAPALVHGDYQPGNMLYEGGRLTGIIDWELASIGSPLLDVGWLMMLADPLSWRPDWRPLCPLTPRAIAVRYGAEPAAMAWWQALAGYRLGSISCLNVHLHRSGRRPDVVWERFASAIPAMFGRATALLRDADALNEPEP